jgi:hypothetical protein
MSDTRPKFYCSRCGQPICVDECMQGLPTTCSACGSSVVVPGLNGTASNASPREAEVPERLRTVGLTIPLLALSAPTIGALGCFYVASSELSFLGLGIGAAVVVATALLLTIDVARLGTYDRTGAAHSGWDAMLLGMLLLWIVFFPYVFFRRRHYAGPNLGPVATIVVIAFLVAPFVGVIAGLLTPPSCGSPEVVHLIDQVIRESPRFLGVGTMTIKYHRDVRYDGEKKRRLGRCEIETVTGRLIPVTYAVEWLDRDKRLFSVQIVDE